MNECEVSNPCTDPGTMCLNTDGAYECLKTTAIAKVISDRQKTGSNLARNCSAGYKPRYEPDSGTTTCVDINECSEQLDTCSSDERCVNEIGGYRWEISATCFSKNAVNSKNAR